MANTDPDWQTIVLRKNNSSVAHVAKSNADLNSAIRYVYVPTGLYLYTCTFFCTKFAQSVIN